MSDDTFSIDIGKIREQATQRMNEGAVTGTYGKDAGRVVDVLNDVLASEIVCWMRYTQHATVAAGIDRAQVASEFTQHAEEERGHTMKVAERINQLGGQPDFDPATLAKRSHTDYRTFDDADLRGMLRENLVAERIVISSYQEIIRWLGDGDVTTRRMMESLLGDEEEHADDILDLLGRVEG